MRKIVTLSLVALTMMTSAACKKGAANGDDGGIFDGGKGVHAVGDDPAVVAIFKAAVACKMDEYGSFDSDCPAMKTYDEDKSFEDGKADPTLLNLISDTDEKIRRLAFKKLAYRGNEKTFTDTVAVAKLLDAVEAEKFDKNLESAAEAAGRVDVKATGTFDRIKKMFAADTVDAKKRLDKTLMSVGSNTKNDDVWAWHKSLLNDADAAVRLNAMDSYWGTPSNLRRPEVCVIYHDNFGHADVLVAAKAAAFSSGGSECIGDLDKAIDEVDKRHKAGQITSGCYDFISVLGDPWKNSKITAAHKKHKTAVATSLVLDPKVPDNIRRGALQGVNDADHVAGKALATRVLKDKDIGSYAKSVVDKK